MGTVAENIVIRSASESDAEAIAAVRRASWRAAYAGIITPAALDRATAPGTAPVPWPPYLRMLVAVSDAQRVAGYLSFGPERLVATSVPARPPAQPLERLAGYRELTDAGRAGETGEVYALYLHPKHWSTGSGRALMAAALDGLRDAACRRAVLWVLTENARARRFYAKAGFAADGATNTLVGLGGVEELRYVREL
jgi:GNAT superfamily N-acetyltransferase